MREHATLERERQKQALNKMSKDQINRVEERRKLQEEIDKEAGKALAKQASERQKILEAQALAEKKKTKSIIDKLNPFSKEDDIGNPFEDDDVEVKPKKGRPKKKEK